MSSYIVTILYFPLFIHFSEKLKESGPSSPSQISLSNVSIYTFTYIPPTFLKLRGSVSQHLIKVNSSISELNFYPPSFLRTPLQIPFLFFQCFNLLFLDNSIHYLSLPKKSIFLSKSSSNYYAFSFSLIMQKP